ncbi:MAG: hypothetical protein H6828_09025 [Planctomycetes bacterium]|nr:hypothetical protein [Planctomycetota bacterium]
MTPQDLFGVAVRTVGLLLVLATGYVVVLLALASLGNPSQLDNGAFWGAALLPGMGLVVGVWLMRRSEVVVRFGFPAHAQPLELRLLGKYDARAGRAYLTGRRGEGLDVPLSGRVWLHAAAEQDFLVLDHARALVALGYEVVAEAATLKALWQGGVPVTALSELPGAPQSAADALETDAFVAVFGAREDAELVERARERGLLTTSTTASLERAVGGLVARHAEEARKPTR